MNPEITFLDYGVGPRERDELILADHLACALDESSEDIERSATQANRDAVLQK